MKELKEYLQNEWRRCNHARYQKYFEEWYINLTPQQIEFYTAYSKGFKTL